MSDSTISDLPISRKEALQKGLKYYFTGDPCARGHISKRYSCSHACVTCFRIRQKVYIDKNIDKLREKCRNRARKHSKENRVLYLSKKKDYRKNNKEKIAQRKKDWNKKNRKKILEYAKIHSRLRRARKKAVGKIDKSMLLELLFKQKNKCINCLQCVKRKYHLDHIMPVSKGGDNSKSNLQILCPACNLKKHAKLPLEWARENGRLI